MYHYWNNESDKGEACAIFGDGWDSPFQYEDKEGTVVGCYLDDEILDLALIGLKHKEQLPQERTDKRTESHACDSISRQAARDCRNT